MCDSISFHFDWISIKSIPNNSSIEEIVYTYCLFSILIAFFLFITVFSGIISDELEMVAYHFVWLKWSINWTNSSGH